MRKRQTGIIYTNGNCIGCNRCIMSCPVPGANKSVSKDGKNIIVVDPEKCIHCGNCSLKSFDSISIGSNITLKSSGNTVNFRLGVIITKVYRRIDTLKMSRNTK